MPRTIGNYKPIPTLRESFNAGFETGRTWKDDYTPRGPYVFELRGSEQGVWKQYCQATAENRKSWMMGFYDGIEKDNS